MSQWIARKVSYPPESHSVLLYAIHFHENGKNISDESIFVGFYGKDDYDEEGFYFEHTDKSWTLIKETDYFKIIAWTLLPRKPYKGILEGDWSG
jgi:hypothetical protein